MARIRSLKPELWTQQCGDGKPAFAVYCIAEVGSEATGPCKIGIASHLQKRLSSLQGGNWRPIDCIWHIRLADRELARNVEWYCLTQLRRNIYSPVTSDQRLASEWVTCAPFAALRVAVDYLTACGEVIERVA